MEEFGGKCDVCGREVGDIDYHKKSECIRSHMLGVIKKKNERRPKRPGTKNSSKQV